jgi:hypothetical protein
MINFYDHIEGDKLKLQNPNGDDFILVDKEQALADIKLLLKKNAEFKIQSDKQTLKKNEEDLNKSETLVNSESSTTDETSGSTRGNKKKKNTGLNPETEEIPTPTNPGRTEEISLASEASELSDHL